MAVLIFRIARLFLPSVFFLTGCMMVPVPHPEMPLQLRPGVSGPADWQFVRPTVTRREEVLLGLGEPDFRWRDDRVFAYQWSGTELFMVVVVYPGLAGADNVPKEHFLLIEFDKQGIVTRLEERYDKAFDLVSVKQLQKTWGPVEDAP